MAASNNEAGVSGRWWVALVVVLSSMGLSTAVRSGAEPPLDAPSTQSSTGAGAPTTVPPLAAHGSTAHDEGPSEYCLKRFLAPLRNTFVDSANARRVSAASPPANWKEHVRAEQQSYRAQITPIIVTVPDPIDSGMGYAFDTALQAVRLGTETRLDGQPALYRDHSWLPWEDTVPPDARPRESEECRNEVPGLILFRGAPDVARLTALLLVGETPTTGLHRVAMTRALELSDIFVEYSGGGAPTMTRILGPTFSGTTASLRASLQAWARDPTTQRKVQIITGSATGGALRRGLHSEGGPSSWMRNGEVEFWSTTVPESELQCRYLHRVHSRGRHAEGSAPTPVESVALLHESGTEYGAALEQDEATDPRQRSCDLQAGIEVVFPAQISALRDAYEKMDHPGAAPDALARRTNLAVSLREKHPPRGIDAEPSPKTTFARDIAVSRVLAAVADSRVRHVVITATDVADAIFLARKVRDVAPDVRLAFLNSDVLLLHPAFRRTLVGALVVTPYPFLGSSDFLIPNTPRRHQGFESSSVQGIFNAMLALRGARPRALTEYVAPNGAGNLPVWLTAIGRGRFVPLSMLPNHVPRHPNDEREDVVYRGADRAAGRFQRDAARATFAPIEDRKVAWEKAVRPLLATPPSLARDVTLPRLWRFLLIFVFIWFAVDRVMHRRARDSLSVARFPSRGAAAVGSTDADADRQTDRAIVRCKWELYAAVRTFAIGAGYVYLALFWACGAFLYGGSPSVLEWGKLGCLAFGALIVARYFIKDVRVFIRDYRAFAVSTQCRPFPLQWADALSLWCLVRRAFHPVIGPLSSVPPLQHPASGTAPQSTPSRAFADSDQPDRWDRTTLPFGLARAESAVSPATLSFAQLRVLTAVTLLVGSLFVMTQALGLYDITEIADERSPLLHVLVVHRTLQLGSGVSAGAPTLSFLALLYAWAVGRMGRLRLAHSLSQLSPPDQVLDVVSTPIRLVLYPDHTKERPNDDAFTRVERRVVNTILRPITGPVYCGALAAVIGLPLLVFALTPVATLEGPLDVPLICLYYCGFVLIGCTLIQLFQYWIALERLLKRVLQHPLGRSFVRARPFVRDTIYEQVSRRPNDLLRLAACADQFDTIVRWGRRLPNSIIEPQAQRAFEIASKQLQERRATALTAGNSRDVRAATRATEKLGEGVLDAAHEVMKLVWSAWRGHLPATRHVPSIAAPAVQAMVLHIGSRSSAVRKLGWVHANPRVHGVNASPRVAPSELRAPDVAPTPSPDGERIAATSFDQGLDQGSERWRYSPQELRWLQDAEVFAATVVALLINRHVRQLQYFVYTLLACTLLLMLGTMSYPFEPHRLLSTWVWGLMLTVVGASLGIYIELDRNTLLSHIASSDAGKMTLDSGLVSRVLAWGIAPLTAAAATEYPDLVNTVVRWLSLGGAN